MNGNNLIWNPRSRRVTPPAAMLPAVLLVGAAGLPGSATVAARAVALRRATREGKRGEPGAGRSLPTERHAAHVRLSHSLL